jgi:hypothetical protein
MSLVSRLEDLIAVIGFDIKDLDSRIPQFLNLDGWHLIGTAGEPAFQNNWVSYGIDRKPRYRKQANGMVKLAGALKSGTNSTTAFTLPVGYRPSSVVSYTGLFSGGPGQITILPTGEVQLSNIGSSNGAIQAVIDVVEFDTETVSQILVGPKGDPGEPGPAMVNLTAVNYVPSYDVDEATSGWGNELTVGRPDDDDYVFTSVEVYDPDQASPSGLIYVQTLVGIYSSSKVWRRFRVGPYIGTWEFVGKEIIHTETIAGNQDAYSASFAASSAPWVFRNATQVLELLYTPPVDAWVEVNSFMGYVRKDDAAYHYLVASLTMVTGADADGISATSDLITQHSQVNQFESRKPSRIFKCVAGTAYQFRIQLSGNGGNWAYYRGAAQMYMNLKAWRR